jgi:hypothetical protein
MRVFSSIKLSRETKEWLLFFLLALIIFVIAYYIPFQSLPLENISNGQPLISSQVITKAVDTEAASLLQKTQTIAHEKLLLSYITQGDEVGTLGLLREERLSQKVDLIQIADMNGIVFASFPTIKGRGTDLFLTTTWGREFNQGKEGASIGKGVLYPLVMVGSHSLTDESGPTGVIFTEYILNDTYAHSFRDTYLNPNTEISFITAADGVVGSTLVNTEAVKYLKTYITANIDSLSTLAKNQSYQRIKLDNKYYFIQVIPLSPTDAEAGYALVMQPSTHESVLIIIAACIALFFLLFESYIHHVILRHSWRSRHYVPLIIVALLLFAGLFLTLISHTDQTFYPIEPTPYLLYNSTLSLSPDFGIFDKTSEQHIAIKVNTGAESINAAAIHLRYDPAQLKIIDISTINSFCDQSLFLEKSSDNENGTVTISCAVANPGFSGTDGTVADLVIQALKEGPISLTFDDNTAVLANDGLGTDVLRLATGAHYTAINRINGAKIFSPTHPNNERWYNKPDVTFVWNMLPDAFYLYGLDQDPTGSKTTWATTTATTLTTHVPHDGTYYFHLKPIQSNEAKAILTYKVNIDTEPPEKPTITSSSLEVHRGDIIRLNFSASDSLSGLQKTSYMKIGNNLFLPTKPPLFIPAQEPGILSITIRAFDLAGNYSDATTEIVVR